MSQPTDRQHPTSGLAMHSYPHMDNCPCADHARHFELTPGHQAYLDWLEYKGPLREKGADA